jgi:hypothetical protein
MNFAKYFPPINKIIRNEQIDIPGIYRNQKDKKKIKF